MFHLRFDDDPQPFWIVIEAGEPSVCLTDPGYEVDVTISSDLPTLYQVWLGRLPVRQAVKAGTLTFAGNRAVTSRMPGVFQLSPISGAVIDAS